MTYAVRAIRDDFTVSQQATAESDDDAIGLTECAFENFADCVMVEIESVAGSLVILDRGQEVSLRSDFS